ncbi:Glutaredoxin [Dillenia turbinata]|uniref:Glutaredoxin n=1 Tax=Dillenia turbinata TaxID=194707 RepID=A0AAN8Z9J9_9MAGN
MGSLVGEGKFCEADVGNIVSMGEKETKHDSLNENQSKPVSDDLPHNQQLQDLLEIGKNKDGIQIPPVAVAVRNIDTMIPPHSQLPKPEAPPGKNPMNSQSPPSPEKFSGIDMPAFGKFFQERSNSLSSAIAKKLSSLSEDRVTEFNLSGLKVIVQHKKDDQEVEIEHGNLNSKIRGRITFFSRSNCRDCTAVRSFLRERGLRFVEINVDVYPPKERELIERTGSSSVPQIFFNEKLLGGLVALNSLRNSGEFDRRLVEMVGRKCPDAAPAPPVYGFDDPEVERTDEMASVIRVLRQRLPIQDRLMRLKIVKNCFSGFETVGVMVQHLHCSRNKAVEIGKQLARKHFIHHVFGENDFEDGNHFYRFLEHEPLINKCFNFGGSINDNEPKPAAVVGQRLTKIMSAILESYASEDRCHIDYDAIGNSEEFRRYVNLTQDLHRVDVAELSSNEKQAFFLNLYNAMVIHAMIRVGRPNGGIDRRSLYAEFQYLVGGYAYSLTTIKNGILRGNRRPPYTLVKQFGATDKRLEVALLKVNPLIHFGLCNGTRSSPTVRFFTPHGIEAELRTAAREFFRRGGIEVELDKRTVSLTRMFKWFDVDFGQDKEILKWVIPYLDSTKAGLLTHLLSDGGPVNIVYQNHDWSVNS